jgi:ubiquinone/menaquinone biosynthesis C-methylase UbiE
VTRFGAVDAEPDPEGFIEFLDAMNSLPDFRALKDRMIARLRLEPGHRVLDVGCGTGDDVRHLAESVGSGGRVVGLDFSQAMVDEARSRSAGSGLPVEFRQGDITQLDLPDATFDAVRCERVLLHLPDPAVAVGEMARVLRPGGRLVVYDIDFDTGVVDHPDHELSGRIMHALADCFANGRIGRHLRTMFLDAGLDEVEVAAHTTTEAPFSFFAGTFRSTLGNRPDVIDPADLEGWLADLEAAEKAERLFGAMTGFIVSGTHP